MTGKFLGVSKLKNEGEPVPFDEAFPDERPPSRGYGQTMRGADLANVWLIEETWYVVRDKACSYDIDDPEAAVWTLSRTPGEPGWNTDSGYNGYGLVYSDARELADAVNIKLR